MSNSNVLAMPQQAQNANQDYSKEQVQLIKNTVAKGATDDELKMFISIAKKYDLDPLIKEIWFIKRAKKHQDKTGKWDYKRLPNGEIDYSGAETSIMTSRDGYLKIAQRNPDFDGVIGFPVREGDIFEIDAQNYQVTHKFGAKRGKIMGAWARVDHKRRRPVIVYVDFQEYYSANSSVWKQYPSAMIQKVAEVLALKRQFGISGLVTKEEMKGIDLEERPDYTEGSKIINIKPEDVQTDDEAPEDKPEEEDAPQPEMVSAEQLRKISRVMKDKAINGDEAKLVSLSKFGKESSKALTKDEADQLIKELEDFVPENTAKQEEAPTELSGEDLEGTPFAEGTEEGGNEDANMD